MHNRYSTAADRYRSEATHVTHQGSKPNNSIVSVNELASSHQYGKFSKNDMVSSSLTKQGKNDSISSQQSAVAHQSPPVHKLNDFYLFDHTHHYIPGAGNQHKFKQSPYGKGKLMKSSIIYKGPGGNLNGDQQHVQPDPLELSEDGVARNAHSSSNVKQVSMSIPQKRQLAQRQQRAIYGQQQGVMLAHSQNRQPVGAESDLAITKASLSTTVGRLPGLASIKEKGGAK